MSQSIRSQADPPIDASFATSEAGKTASPAGVFVFRHFPQLDGLRGLAILLVIAGHTLQYSYASATCGALGGLGVLLFFVLSGFLITGLIDREKTQAGSLALPRFYFRRALRLFPALFFFLAVVCLLIKLRVIVDTPWYAVLACLIYVRDIWGRGYATNHIWSLSVEEQFYASWPWIMNAVSRVNALRIAAGGAIAVSLFRMVAIQGNWFNYWGGTFYERPWFRFDSILIGCAIALRLCDSPDAGRFRRYLPRLALPALLWPGLIAWTLWGEAVTHTWFLTLQSVFAALILLHLLLSEDSVYLRVFSHPVAAWLGRISYSWYLWQQLFTVFDHPARTWLHTFPLNVGLSLLLALASHKWIERPFLKLKDRLSESVEAGMSAVPWMGRAARLLWKPPTYAG